MDPVRAEDLAALLPIPVDQIPFQYEIKLDSTYDNPDGLAGVALVDLTKLPAQVYQVCTQTAGGQRYYCGVNVFQDGLMIKYQPFYWLGGIGASATPPPQGFLDSDGDWRQVGIPCVLTQDNPQEATAAVSLPDVSLSTSVQPLFCTTSQSILSLDSAASPASPQPVLASVTAESTQDEKDTASVQVSYSETQIFTTSNTHSYALEFGIGAELECSVSWFGLAGAKFKLSASFKFTFTTSSTNSQSVSQTYTWSDTIPVPLKPNETKYASVLVYADDNASTTVTAKYQISGSINGQPMTGVFLQQLVSALDATQTPPHTTAIEIVDASSLTYTDTFTVTANIVFTCIGGLWDTYPTLDQVVARAEDDMAKGQTQQAAAGA